MNESQLALFFQLQGFVQCIRIRAAMQHNLDILATKTFNRFDFNRRCGFGYDDGRVAFEFRSRVRHTLRMVARRGGNHAFFELFGCELRHFIVRPTDFV